MHGVAHVTWLRYASSMDTKTVTLKPRKTAYGYALVDTATGAVVGRAWRNGQCATAGRSWTYRVDGSAERKTNTLGSCVKFAARDLAARDLAAQD